MSVTKLYHETSTLDVFHRVIRFLERQAKLNYLVFVVDCLLLAFYVTARLFLVVEAFNSLRKMPVDVYTTPI